MIPILQPKHTDPDLPPHPENCVQCNGRVPWVWLPLEHRNKPSRWIRGLNANGRCKGCRKINERIERAERLQKAQKRARIPRPFWSYRLDCLEFPFDNETPRDFRNRVRKLKGPTIGIDHLNEEAIDELQRFSPTSGNALWVEGPVGTGKSMLAAAAGTALLEGKTEPGQSGPMTIQEAVQRGWTHEEIRATRWKPENAGAQVLFIEEPELHSRARLSWKGDPYALYNVSNAGVLILDDLGTAGRGSNLDVFRPVAGPVHDTIERLICYRADRKLPTIITSNVPIDMAEALYGKRVASRLQAWMKPLLIEGNWRNAA